MNLFKGILFGVTAIAVGVAVGTAAQKIKTELEVRHCFDLVYNSTFDVEKMPPVVLEQFKALKGWVNETTQLTDAQIIVYTESIMPYMIETLV